MEIVYVAAAIALIILIGIYVIPGIYWLLAHVSFYFFYIMDELFSANFFTGIPWFAWGIAGGLIGASIVFLSVSARYGMRRKKILILLMPFIIILFIRWICYLTTLFAFSRRF
ncbi:MAG: hypothetical protein WCO98_09955 [bacterium]